jgi:hypothetical protein
MSEVLRLPISSVLAKFHPENPREHSEENDLPWIRDSLLDFGWLIYPTIQRNLDGSFGYLISGHGRVQGADWLSQQDEDFFLKEWDRWIKGTGRDKVAEKHRERFCANYWTAIPVVPVTLDELSQKSALLRLNNTSHDGRDDPGKIAAILAQMPKRQIKTAGWDTSTANSFMRAFLVRKEEPEEEQEETGYDFDDEKYPNPQMSEDGTTIDVTPSRSDYTPPPPAEKVIVETENVTDVGAVQSINYTGKGEQTQFFIFLDKGDLANFRSKLDQLAPKIGISTEGMVQQYRSQVILKIVDMMSTELGVAINDSTDGAITAENVGF